MPGPLAGLVLALLGPGGDERPLEPVDIRGEQQVPAARGRPGDGVGDLAADQGREGLVGPLAVAIDVDQPAAAGCALGPQADADPGAGVLLKSGAEPGLVPATEAPPLPDGPLLSRMDGHRPETRLEQAQRRLEGLVAAADGRRPRPGRSSRPSGTRVDGARIRNRVTHDEALRNRVSSARSGTRNPLRESEIPLPGVASACEGFFMQQRQIEASYPNAIKGGLAESADFGRHRAIVDHAEASRWERGNTSHPFANRPGSLPSA